MKLSKILLRWYKSFNISYDGGADRQAGIAVKPWNTWKFKDGRQEVFPFVEIPVERDVTTVVGANESGKSHLLSAISKVITGEGIPGDPFGRDATCNGYAQTDLCHYASVLEKNLTVWPHIGLAFECVTQDELKDVLGVIDRSLDKPHSTESRITLIMTNEEECLASLYIDDEKAIPLSEAQLVAVRAKLPAVKFINSQVGIADQIELVDLLAAYSSEQSAKKKYFRHKAAQKAAEFVDRLTYAPGTALPTPTANELTSIKNALAQSEMEQPHPQLELLLFRDVLGISIETLEGLYNLDETDRAHAESLIAKWNEEIERTLNLSRYWQQDQEFSLRINYKQGVLYFEITDKTGCIYTFKERSSGLRYFLSYYIQAKALESAIKQRDCIILMDEPDSFLSILGQRNLLSIFESLVSADLSKQNTQIVYTTHSPFLINRNFPRRIRLVRKGDGEEGTQFIDQSRIRRFEPVRSALGIDLAQTLFMGTTNILLEGPADQYLLAEAIRFFADDEGMNDLLDLNSMILVSSEGASGVEKVLSASRWADEPIPTALVVLDGDEEGARTKRVITGVERNCRQLLEEQFVTVISDVIKPFGDNKVIVTMEDIIPVVLYQKAVSAYIERWCRLERESKRQVKELLKDKNFAAEGLVSGTLNLFDQAVHDQPQGYDKLGVLQEFFKLLPTIEPGSTDRQQFGTNVLELCRFLRGRIELSERAERRRSGKQAVQRIIGDFFVKHKNSASPYEFDLLFERLERETNSFGEDAKHLRSILTTARTEIKKLRSAGQDHIAGDNWNLWQGRLEAIRKNPLSPDDSKVASLMNPQVEVEASEALAEAAKAPVS